jgi:hypothetical protein
MTLALRSLLLLPLAAACGPGPTSSDDGSSSTATAADADSTAAAATAMASSDSAAGSSEDGSGCPALADESSPGAITLEITNMRAEGVWLPMSADCIVPVPWVLTGADGAEVPWRAPACGTCAGAVQGQCPCPPPFCDEVTGLYLEAGASVQYEWSGLVYVDETIPAACPGIASCGETCQRAEVAASGDFTFAIQAGEATGCAVEPCACMPTDGSCTLLDYEMTFTELTDVEGTVTLPGGSMVQLAIE